MDAVTSVRENITRNARLAACILFWFLANGSTVIFNKHIFQNMHFRFPLTLTLVHMTTQSILAYLTLDCAQLVPRLKIKRHDYFSKILVISAVFCCNICLGNISLNFVPVSFMQTVKSLTPAVTAFLQFLLFGSRLKPQALLSLVPVTSGVALASITELEFHIGGFLAALASCVMTGLKFVLSSQLFAGRYKFDSINLLYYMAPPSVCFLLAPALLLESKGVQNWWQAPETNSFHLFLLLLSGVLSFLLNVSILVVLKATSSVTVTVAGNVKTVLVIGASILLFNNAVTPLSSKYRN